jgi:UDP-N-acetylglucosamine 2-epimerase (non-hydrolysing)
VAYRDSVRITRPTPATIVYVVGARPNFVKMAPVASEMRLRAPHLRHVVVHTGQHFDREMSDLFFDDLDLSEPDYLLGVGSGSHGAQTGRALERIEDVLLRERPGLVVVPGDVNSTLAAALAAAKLGIPVAHLEAGLRSFDRTMPEELNRVLVDQIAEWCLIHSPEAEENLVREGIERSRVHFVGNTMIDSLVRLLPRAKESTVLDRLELAPGNFLLVTLHRPSLVDGSALAGIAGGLAELSRTIPLVFPVHPRTRARLAELDLPPGRMKLIEPLGYIDFLALEASARGVITDSGGVQEETTFLQVPCFTLRDNTERPITVRQGTNRLLGLDPDALRLIPTLLDRPRRPSVPPAGWEGSASVRAARVLLGGLAAASQTSERGESRATAAGRTR